MPCKFLGYSCLFDCPSTNSWLWPMWLVNLVCQKERNSLWLLGVDFPSLKVSSTFLRYVLDKAQDCHQSTGRKRQFVWLCGWCHLSFKTYRSEGLSALASSVANWSLTDSLSFPGTTHRGDNLLTLAVASVFWLKRMQVVNYFKDSDNQGVLSNLHPVYWEMSCRNGKPVGIVWTLNLLAASVKVDRTHALSCQTWSFRNRILIPSEFAYTIPVPLKPLLWSHPSKFWLANLQVVASIPPLSLLHAFVTFLYRLLLQLFV